MEKLTENPSASDIVAKINELIDHVNGIRVRDRGPRSSRSMVRLDAWRVLHGDLKDADHKKAAEILGLSYGQVYSARGTYTFKDVKKDEFHMKDVTELKAVDTAAEKA